MYHRPYVILLILTLLMAGALFVKSVLVPGQHPFDLWTRSFPALGSFAEPGLADLNGDGVLDVVLGAGRGRLVASDSAVLALDGRDGRLLWTQSSRAELFGRPTFLQLTADTVPDPVLHGRQAELMALDGRSGAVLWRYQTQDTVINAVGYVRFNFYQPQVVPDQNGDGRPDLLTTNGGNEVAPPFSTGYRYPGVLLLISGADGQVIAADTMPDGRETYLAPLLLPRRGAAGPDIIFGTGGETQGGSLYRIALPAFRRSGLAGAERLAHAEQAGFIGQPVAAELTGDGQPDVFVAAHRGPALALDGASGALLWQQDLPDTRLYGQWASGYFTADATPDLLLTGAREPARGASGARQWLLDGRNGTIVFRDSLGCGTLARPLALPAPVAGAPQDILLSVNSFFCQRPAYDDALHYLLRLDPRRKTSRPLYPPGPYKNIASTPWLGDVDADGAMDVVLVQQRHGPEYWETGGLTVQRLQTDLAWPIPNDRDL